MGKNRKIRWGDCDHLILFVVAAILGLILGILFSGCCPKMIPIGSTDTKDSIQVEYREIIREVPVEIPVPVEVRVSVVRPDSTSVLQTSLAKSTASLIDGWLHHTLEHRQDDPPVVNIPVKDTESHKYEYKEVIKNVPYPVKTPLTKWQKFRMDVGGWLLGAMGLLVVWVILKKFVLK